ncbi:putative clathrin assembly protein At1g25240 [Bidens hawaiensis]|uniref:putative clathrin assembly protein At1g25240 n=1 Tax=Bidens hawaiensis TaxID=980011 RepID=UPI004049C087
MWTLKGASNAFKDARSLLIANFTPRSSSRNPEIEAAVIKATNHDNSRVDYRSAQLIFAWIRVSGHYIRPVMSALTTRMDKTRTWTVALKGLMLLHGVFTCKVPAVHKIGHLPFDLSNFKDRRPNMQKQEAFIRAYYTYLSKKAAFLAKHSDDKKEGSLRRGHKERLKQWSMMQHLAYLENLQGLLNMLLEIKPQGEKMINALVLEAMNCIVLEIYDVYSRVCNGIAAVLVRIYSIGKTEARMAVSILQKASSQAEVLSQYIDYCRDLGVAKAVQSPRIVRIRDDDIQELEQIIENVVS